MTALVDDLFPEWAPFRDAVLHQTGTAVEPARVLGDTPVVRTLLSGY